MQSNLSGEVVARGLFMSSNEIHVPQIFLGTPLECRRRWHNVVSAVWSRSGNLSLVDGLKLVPLSFRDDVPLIVQEMSPGWLSTEHLWHIHLVHTCWDFPGGSGWRWWRQQFDFVMRGMEFPWFAMGMLIESEADLFFLRDEFILANCRSKVSDEESYRKTVIFPWFDRILMWYLDVARYGHRFCYSYPGTPLTRFSGSTWMLGLMKSMARWGLCSFDLVVACKTLTPDELGRELALQERIEMRDGRLRLKGELIG